MKQETSNSSATETMISLRNLHVSYGDQEILHGINFDVLRGETMVILGGSGWMKFARKWACRFKAARCLAP